MKLNHGIIGSAFALAALTYTPTSIAADGGGASPLPVLLVIADQRDFYYAEYAETRSAIEALGVRVHVAATSTKLSYPHPNSGQPAGSDGSVKPDLTLAQAKASDYSAIAFVGGWGASMYQYAYNDPNLDGVIDNYYWNAAYNGDDNLKDGRISKSKVVVNNLINDFVDQDKYVAAICHGVTVLAWARVDGSSPIAGRYVSVPFIGSPAMFFFGTWYADFQLGQYEQVVANGAYANETSGAYGDPTTVADDVVVDGRIITGENFNSARLFGTVIAKSILGGATTR